MTLYALTYFTALRPIDYLANDGQECIVPLNFNTCAGLSVLSHCGIAGMRRFGERDGIETQSLALFELDLDETKIRAV